VKREKLDLADNTADLSQLRLTVLNKIMLISTCQKFARLTCLCYLLQVRAIYMYLN